MGPLVRGQGGSGSGSSVGWDVETRRLCFDRPSFRPRFRSTVRSWDFSPSSLHLPVPIEGGARGGTRWIHGSRRPSRRKDRSFRSSFSRFRNGRNRLEKEGDRRERGNDERKRDRDGVIGSFPGRTGPIRIQESILRKEGDDEPQGWRSRIRMVPREFLLVGFVDATSKPLRDEGQRVRTRAIHVLFVREDPVRRRASSLETIMRCRVGWVDRDLSVSKGKGREWERRQRSTGWTGLRENVPWIRVAGRSIRPDEDLR